MLPNFFVTCKAILKLSLLKEKLRRQCFELLWEQNWATFYIYSNIWSHWRERKNLQLLDVCDANAVPSFVPSFVVSF